MPLPIEGLVSHYLTNSLIGRRLILQPQYTKKYYDLRKRTFQYLFPISGCPQFPEVIQVCRVDYLRVTKPVAAEH